MFATFQKQKPTHILARRLDARFCLQANKAAAQQAILG